MVLLSLNKVRLGGLFVSYCNLKEKNNIIFEKLKDETYFFLLISPENYN